MCIRDSLQGLEHDKIDEEYRNLMALIKELTEILADENLLLDVIKKELLDLKAKYNDERRTKIVQNPGEIDIEDLIEEEASVIAMTSLNYIKRTPLDTYKSQNRGGRGIIGMQTREEMCIRDREIVAQYYNIRPEDIIGSKRNS